MIYIEIFFSMSTDNTNMNSIHEDDIEDYYPTLSDMVEDLKDQADHIGKHIEMWNKDDIPEALTETTGDNDEYNYDEEVPVVVKIVAYALGINYVQMQEDIDGIKWPHNGYHNIVFDEQGRQIGHMIYPIKNCSKGQVVLYTTPINPQIQYYEEE